MVKYQCNTPLLKRIISVYERIVIHIDLCVCIESLICFNNIVTPSNGHIIAEFGHAAGGFYIASEEPIY